MDGVGHISVGLTGEQVHHTGGETMIQHRGLKIDLLNIKIGSQRTPRTHCSSPWIVFSGYSLHKRKEITAEVHTDCWLPAVVFILSRRKTRQKKGKKFGINLVSFYLFMTSRESLQTTTLP